MEDTIPVADGIDAIDTHMLGRYELTSAYLIRGDQPALIETGPATSARSVLDGLRSLGMDPADLAHVIVFLASDAARAVHGAALPVTGLS